METEALKIHEIDIIDIIIEGQSVRYQMDDDHVVELAMSISKIGLLEPIVLQEVEDGKYQLIAGSHRLAAFVRLGRKTIPAIIRPNDGSPIKGLALIENIIRRDMSLAEEVDAVIFLTDEEKLSASQICELLGKSRDWVNKRLAIPGMPKEVIDALLEGRLSLRHAEIITRVENQGLRNLLINNVFMQRLSASQTQELAALYMSTPTMEDAIQAGEDKMHEIQTPKEATRRCDSCGRVRLLRDIMFAAICHGGCQEHQILPQEPEVSEEVKP